MTATRTAPSFTRFILISDANSVTFRVSANEFDRDTVTVTTRGIGCHTGRVQAMSRAAARKLYAELLAKGYERF